MAQHGALLADGREVADTLQCPHCGGHFTVAPQASPHTLGRFCHTCHALCCPKPGCQTCTPFMKAIEASEKADRLRRALL